jgi:hypothetical protein
MPHDATGSHLHRLPGRAALGALAAALTSFLFAAAPAAAQVSFAGPTNFAAGEAPKSVAVADFDGDSDRDLATANFFSSFPSNASVLLGMGPAASTARPTSRSAVRL